VNEVHIDFFQHIIDCPYHKKRDIVEYINDYKKVSYKGIITPELLSKALDRAFTTPNPLIDAGHVYHVLLKYDSHLVDRFTPSLPGRFKDVILGLWKGFDVKSRKDYERFEKSFLCCLDIQAPSRKDVIEAILSDPSAIETIAIDEDVILLVRDIFSEACPDEMTRLEHETEKVKESLSRPEMNLEEIIEYIKSHDIASNPTLLKRLHLKERVLLYEAKKVRLHPGIDALDDDLFGLPETKTSPLTQEGIIRHLTEWKGNIAYLAYLSALTENDGEIDLTTLIAKITKKIPLDEFGLVEVLAEIHMLEMAENEERFDSIGIRERENDGCQFEIIGPKGLSLDLEGYSLRKKQVAREENLGIEKVKRIIVDWYHDGYTTFRLQFGPMGHIILEL